MADSKYEDPGSDPSYCHSSDFNLLHYTPIRNKKLPKAWFPHIYPQYADHTPEKSQSGQAPFFSSSTPHHWTPRPSTSPCALRQSAKGLGFKIERGIAQSKEDEAVKEVDVL